MIEFLAAIILQAASPTAATDSRRAAIVEYFAAIGETAYFLGACERHLPSGEGDRFVASILQQNEYQATPELQTTLRATFADLYAEGRTDPDRLRWTVDQCQRLIEGAVAGTVSEAEQLRATFGEPAK